MWVPDIGMQSAGIVGITIGLMLFQAVMLANILLTRANSRNLLGYLGLVGTVAGIFSQMLMVATLGGYGGDCNAFWRSESYFFVLFLACSGIFINLKAYALAGFHKYILWFLNVLVLSGAGIVLISTMTYKVVMLPDGNCFPLIDGGQSFAYRCLMAASEIVANFYFLRSLYNALRYQDKETNPLDQLKAYFILSLVTIIFSTTVVIAVGILRLVDAIPVEALTLAFGWQTYFGSLSVYASYSLGKKEGDTMNSTGGTSQGRSGRASVPHELPQIGPKRV